MAASMNLIEKQESMKGRELPELIEISQSGNAPDNIIALGEISRRNEDKQRMMAMQANPQETIADRVIGRGLQSLMPPTAGPQQAPQPMPAGQGPATQPSPMQPQAPVPMKKGGTIRMADGGLNDYLDMVRQGAAAFPEPSMADMISQAGQFLPDVMGPIRERIANYEAQEPRRRQQDITELLLSIGSGIAGGKSPNFLTNLAGAGPAALESYRGMRQRRSGEEERGLRNALTLGQAESQRQQGIAGLGGRMFEVGANRAQNMIKTSVDLRNSDLNRQNQISVARIQAGATLRAQEYDLVRTMMTQAATMATQLYAQGTQLLDSEDETKREAGERMVEEARYWNEQAQNARDAVAKINPLGINIPQQEQPEESVRVDPETGEVSPYPSFGIPTIPGRDVIEPSPRRTGTAPRATTTPMSTNGFQGDIYNIPTNNPRIRPAAPKDGRRVYEID